MFDLLRKQFFLYKKFCLYLLISVSVTLIDVLASHLSELFLPLIAANTLGVSLGFIIQYFLTARHVYNSKSPRTFYKFFATFLLGLVLANAIVYVFRVWIFADSQGLYPFIVSKLFSIVLPFFLLYFVRKYWIGIPAQSK